MLSILAYGCTSAAGPTVGDFLSGLFGGRDHSKVYSEPHYSRVCRWADRVSEEKNSLTTITDQLLKAWGQLQHSEFDAKSLGVIFASTKGCIEDILSQPAVDIATDPLTPILESFVARANLTPKLKICVSNACSSTLAAIYLANEWISQKRVKTVIVLSADEIGPFVNRGFFSLKALSQTTSQPFGAHRDGLQLGEAASVLIVGESGRGMIEIEGIGLDTEGFAIARPSHSGESLFKACSVALSGSVPDFIVAHGTGTHANDEVEDQVFSRLFGTKKIPVTSTKWSVGHTLGASASLDVIAACEGLKSKKLFSIANTKQIDSKFKSYFVHGPAQVLNTDFTSSLVTSLGFGGVHGALFLKRKLH